MASTTDPFAEPVAVDAPNTTELDAPSWLSRAGCRLHFVRGRTTDAGVDLDI